MESQEAPILRLSMSDKRWAKIQNKVKMKQMTTTKRNQDVPGFHAGDAHDMQMTANSYRIKGNKRNVVKSVVGNILGCRFISSDDMKT